MCVARPKRWDDNVSPTCWIKRTLPNPKLPNNMIPFELIFDRTSRTSPDTLVPQIDDTDRTGGLDNFVESRRQNFREVRLALEEKLAEKGQVPIKDENK